MRIAISARMMKADPTDGITRFTYETVKRLITGHPEHSFILLFDRPHDRQLVFPENTEVVVVAPASRHPLQWYLWHELQIPPVLRKTGADLFFSPDGIISLKSDLPSVPVIHDISFVHRPKDVPFVTGMYYRYFFPRFAEKAARIITVSHFCREDISGTYRINPGKIDVAYNGVADYFIPAGNSEKEKYREVLTEGRHYFLFVGNFSPRKNIPGLIQAYNIFRATTSSDHRLVLAGGRLFLNRETDSVINKSPWKNDIILTGSLRHDRLQMLYASASALVFIPWFEGFGIPASEAMRCGTPVILSDKTSLPEIGGNAALYSDPAKPEETAALMTRIVTDENLRLHLSQAGLARSADFTWDNTASSVWKSVEKALTGKY